MKASIWYNLAMETMQKRRTHNRCQVTDEMRELVFRLAGIGCTLDEISRVMLIPITTLRRRLGAELERGKAKLCMSLRRRQLAVARKGNVSMLIWLGKQYLGQTDRQEVVCGQKLEVIEEIVFSSSAAARVDSDKVADDGSAAEIQ